MSEFHRAAVLAILRQRDLSTADAGAIVDKDDRAALDAFLTGRTDDIDIVPLEDLAHVLGLTVGQPLSAARQGPMPTVRNARTHLGGIYSFRHGAVLYQQCGHLPKI